MKRNTCFAWVLAILLVLTPLCALSADAELAEVWNDATGGMLMQELPDGELADQAELAEGLDSASDGTDVQSRLDGDLAVQAELAGTRDYAAGGKSAQEQPAAGLAEHVGLAGNLDSATGGKSAQEQPAAELADLAGLAEVWDSATGGKSAQEWLDTELAAQAGGAADNFALCLLRSGAALDYSAYAEAVAAKLDEGISNANTRMRAALCLMACGEDIPADIVDDGAGKLGVMSWVWALHLLNNGAPSEQFTAEAVAGKLLELQLDDGGWRVSGDAGDVDVTCMVLQSLAYCEPKSEALNSAIERALNFLSERQKDSGGFASMGEENAESAAQVLIALSGLNIAPDDPRFVKNSRTALDAMLTYQLPTGGFEHLSGTNESPIATAQALQAMIALDMPGEAFYDFVGAKASAEQAGQQPVQGGEASVGANVAAPQELPESKDADSAGQSGDASSSDDESAVAQGGTSSEESVAASQEALDASEASLEHSSDASSNSDESAAAHGGASSEESAAAPQEAPDASEADFEYSGDASSNGDENATAQGGTSSEESVAAPQEALDASEASLEHSDNTSSNGDESAAAQGGTSSEESVAAPQEAQDSAEIAPEQSNETSSRDDASASAQGGASSEESVAAPQEALDASEASPEHSGDASSHSDESAAAVAQSGASSEESVAAPQEALDASEAGFEHSGDASSHGNESAAAQGDASSNGDAGAAVPPPAAHPATLLAVSSPNLPVWKLCAFSAIGALALAGVIFALTRKRARGKHLLAVLLVAAVAAGAVWFVRVDSAADYYDPNALSSANADGSVTLSIRCDSVAGRADDGSTPADGAILPPTQIPFVEGDSVFDALTAAARANSIQLEYEGAEAMAYVTGINYLYEFDYGELSGWQYSVNGERVSLSCGSCALHDGDEILWEYTTDLGGGLR